MSSDSEEKLPDEDQDSGGEEAARLTILTWGKSSRKHKPEASQKNWAADRISIRDYGLNLKKITGKTKELQDCVASDPRFQALISTIVEDIRKHGYSTVSICCEHGRHRSVALAELIKAMHFPDATVKHLDL